jgi:hypothetical protein
MARKKQKYDRHLTHVPKDGPTMKTVFIFWMLLVMPIAGGATYIVYENNPKPFQAAYKGAEWAAGKGRGAYQGWQKQRAEKAAAEERKQRAEAQAAAEGAAGGF